MANEDDNRPVAFMNRNGMTQAVIVGNACRHDFCTGCACTQRDCETNQRATKAQGSESVGESFICHRPLLLAALAEQAVSVGDKAIGAPVASNRLAAAGNAIDPINSAQQYRLRI